MFADDTNLRNHWTKKQSVSEIKKTCGLVSYVTADKILQMLENCDYKCC